MKKIIKWFKDSKKIKRWILLTIVGMIFVCYGFARVYAVKELYFDEILKIVGIFVLGFILAAFGLIYIQRRSLELALKDNQEDEKAFTVSKNVNSKGPKIVVIGGGTGLNNVLKGLKNYTSNLTAIVTVSTYGSKNHKPTEDIKDSIIALAQNTEEMERLMHCTFKENNLKGTDFGDLYLEASRQIFGDFTGSIEKSSKILSMIGRALPVTLDEMRICAELDNGMVIEEKDRIAKETENRVVKINRVYLTPSNCRVAPGVLEAIR